VYKAVYSGALKTVVDLIAPDGLQGKVLLGIATAKLDAHRATVDRAFTELFAFFPRQHRAATLALLDSQFSVTAPASSSERKGRREPKGLSKRCARHCGELARVSPQQLAHGSE